MIINALAGMLHVPPGTVYVLLAGLHVTLDSHQLPAALLHLATQPGHLPLMLSLLLLLLLHAHL